MRDTVPDAPRHPWWCCPALCRHEGSDVIHGGRSVGMPTADPAVDLHVRLVQADEIDDDGQHTHPPELRVCSTEHRGDPIHLDLVVARELRDHLTALIECAHTSTA